MHAEPAFGLFAKTVAMAKEAEVGVKSTKVALDFMAEAGDLKLWPLAPDKFVFS